MRMTIVLTLLLGLIGLPALAKEKVMKCYPYGNANKSSHSGYYKMETSFLWINKYFIRVGGDWKPFCESDETIWNAREKVFVESKDKGSNAVNCYFSNYYVGSNAFDKFDKDYPEKEINYRLIIDFELGSTTLFTAGEQQWLTKAYREDVKCDVIKQQK